MHIPNEPSVLVLINGLEEMFAHASQDTYTRIFTGILVTREKPEIKPSPH